MAIDDGPGPVVVGPRTWAVRVPVDLPVRFTFAYVLAGSDGVLIIDPGWDDETASSAVLDEAIGGLGIASSDIVGVVVTHSHRDHLGSAPDLARRARCWIAMHEHELDDLALSATVAAWREEEHRLFDALGVPAEEAQGASIPRAGVESILRSAHADRRLVDGDSIVLGDRSLRVLHTPGHSPGSIGLAEDETRLMFTGDTLLPRISPNVGWSRHGSPDPLGDYLASLERLAQFGDWTALPGHEWPFTALDTRAAFLSDHHSERKAEILKVLVERGASDSWTLASRLSWSRAWADLIGFQRRIAAAETAAHLHHLARSGLVRMTTGSGADGQMLQLRDAQVFTAMLTDPALTGRH